MQKWLRRAVALLTLGVMLIPLAAATQQNYGNVNCGLFYTSWHWQPGYGITWTVHGGTPIYSPLGVWSETGGWFTEISGIYTNWHLYSDIPDIATHGWTDPANDHRQCYLN